MGEAKRRGTFEQRKAMAIKRNTEALKQQRLAGITMEQNLTPEERKSRNRAGMFLSTLYGVALANRTLTPCKIDKPLDI